MINKYLSFQSVVFKFISLFCFSIFILSGCQQTESVTEEPTIPASPEETVQQSPEPSPSSTPTLNVTNITIDGLSEDWEARTSVFQDPEGDQESGVFDWTVGFAFTNQDSLYILVEMVDPTAPFQIFDISVTTPDHVYQIVWNPGNVNFPIDEWTGDDAKTIGFAEKSEIFLSDVLEAKISLGEIGNPTRIEEINVAVLIGEDWIHGDSWTFTGIPPFADEVDSLPAEAASQPPAKSTTIPSTSPVETANITIDGFADDWQSLDPQLTDPAGDQLEQAPDLAEYTIFLSDTSLYGMVRVHNWGLYEFLNLILMDTEGVNYTIYVGPISGVGGISSDSGKVNYAIPVVGAQEEVIEFKISISDINIIPSTMEELNICCTTEHVAADRVPGFSQIPTIQQVTENEVAIDETPQRPGPGFLIAENRHPDYLYRSFIQGPERSTLGPDGNIYVSDNSGRHIVRLYLDGSTEDMGFWRGVAKWIRHGPVDVAFAPDGTMYLADNAFIYRVLEDNSLERLKINGWPSAIEFGPDGLLYYIETLEWALYRWDMVHDPEFIVQIDDAHDFAFLQDGRLVVVQIGGKAFVVNPETGSSELFFEQLYTPDPIFVTVGPDGDVWIRAIGLVDRVGPNGIKKPIVVEGVEIGDWGAGMPAGSDGWGMSGDIVFDETGRMWLFSGDSRVARFTQGSEEIGLEMDKILPGFNVTDLISDGNGNLLALNNNSNELWRISPSGDIEVLFESTDISTRNGLAVDNEGRIYIGSIDSEILRLEDDGSVSHYAGFGAHRMVFGSDGALYVSVTGRVDDNYEILRLTDVDTFTVLKTELEGERLGDSSEAVFLGNAADGGLFVYEQRIGKLFKLTLDGEEEMYYDFNWLGHGRPWLMGVSPQGVPFFTYHTPAHPSAVGYVSEERELVTVAVEASGDPYGIAFNPEGDILYLATFGAISIIPIHIGN